MKGIAGFYYVVVDSSVYACKARGILRKEKSKPLVGDDVEIEILDFAEMTGNLLSILPRKSELIRPAVANVDQALVIFSMENPKPNIVLLDRFLLMMEWQKMESVICFNKEDLVSKQEVERLREIYESCSYRVLIASAEKKGGIDELRKVLKGRTTVVAGPSGVGKSSLTNLLQEEVFMETGEISRKLKRGKHTTRHSQLIAVGDATYLMDTPGFSSLDTIGAEKEDLRLYFPEFSSCGGDCRFHGCRHMSEPDCAVKQAVGAGKISRTRYENYKLFYEELKEKEKRRY